MAAHMRRVVPAVVALAILGLSPPASADQYALSMFHFNVQYVAGGLVGFPGYPDDLRPEEIGRAHV